MARRNPGSILPVVGSELFVSIEREVKDGANQGDREGEWTL